LMEIGVSEQNVVLIYYYFCMLMEIGVSEQNVVSKLKSSCSFSCSNV